MTGGGKIFRNSFVITFLYFQSVEKEYIALFKKISFSIVHYKPMLNKICEFLEKSYIFWSEI